MKITIEANSAEELRRILMGLLFETKLVDMTRQISATSLRPPLVKILANHGITTLGDIAAKSQRELLMLPDVGQRSLGEIRLMLLENGIDLQS